jgi:hypothetical protein
MEYLVLLIGIGGSSLLFLISSSFSYTKQSFMLGLTGACIGGMAAVLMQNGLSEKTAHLLLGITMGELVLIALFQKLSSGEKRLS